MLIWLPGRRFYLSAYYGQPSACVYAPTDPVYWEVFYTNKRPITFCPPLQSYLIPRHINVYYLLWVLEYRRDKAYHYHLSVSVIIPCAWVFKHHNVNRDTPIIFGALFYAGFICEYPPTRRDVTNDLLSFIWLWDIHCVSTGRIIRSLKTTKGYHITCKYDSYVQLCSGYIYVVMSTLLRLQHLVREHNHDKILSHRPFWFICSLTPITQNECIFLWDDMRISVGYILCFLNLVYEGCFPDHFIGEPCSRFYNISSRRSGVGLSYQIRISLEDHTAMLRFYPLLGVVIRHLL